MDEYIKKYLDYLNYQKNYSKNTIKGYEEDIIFFKQYLTKKKLSNTRGRLPINKRIL